MTEHVRVHKNDALWHGLVRQERIRRARISQLDAEIRRLIGQLDAVVLRVSAEPTIDSIAAHSMGAALSLVRAASVTVRRVATLE